MRENIVIFLYMSGKNTINVSCDTYTLGKYQFLIVKHKSQVILVNRKKSMIVDEFSLYWQLKGVCNCINTQNT
ncbi:hypothetical protein XENTR_v10005876 [Xenopus tropicalis]|nr:hypothetical protein XENTR_v10005876 [Xenopus tropicalis]